MHSWEPLRVGVAVFGTNDDDVKAHCNGCADGGFSVDIAVEEAAAVEVDG
jgi:hypothetical protein